ncbi:MAG: hypothetical protein P4M05_33895 [Bradyrhizobium sp.]|nr:hypothetical protein [Bradyrhizobium sp.]
MKKLTTIGLVTALTLASSAAFAKGGTVSHECDSSPSLCGVTAGSPTQALTSTPEARPRQPTVSKTHGQQLH